MNDKFIGLYDVRDGLPSDESFILATFIRGLYYGNTLFNKIPKQIFVDNYKPVVQTLLSGVHTVIKIACLKEDPNIIIGYSILSSDYQVINWVYVKKAWRTRGVARSLVPQFPTSVSHLTTLGESLLTKFEVQPIFNPFKY